uniref:(northern house mosquito) hypothetical protein n=1 Tax=Culex pipiens TaxID=7175 RepID=A0A8D8AMK6_CULPI
MLIQANVAQLPPADFLHSLVPRQLAKLVAVPNPMICALADSAWFAILLSSRLSMGVRSFRTCRLLLRYFANVRVQVALRLLFFPLLLISAVPATLVMLRFGEERHFTGVCNDFGQEIREGS